MWKPVVRRVYIEHFSYLDLFLIDYTLEPSEDDEKNVSLKEQRQQAWKTLEKLKGMHEPESAG